eukprot:scaffold157971_cov39-Tisochrysis_lutea.AAC.1
MGGERGGGSTLIDPSWTEREQMLSSPPDCRVENNPRTRMRGDEVLGRLACARKDMRLALCISGPLYESEWSVLCAASCCQR